MSQSIEETLEERGRQHGQFRSHATIESTLVDVLNEHGQDLTDIQKVGLRMIFHKATRILNEGHSHIDTWHDIAGYASLVEREMTREMTRELHRQVDE